MIRRSISTLAGRWLLWLAAAIWIAPARGGLGLEHALEWEAQEAIAAAPAPHVATRPLSPHEGLETALWGPGNDAPWLVLGGATSRHVAQLVSRTYANGELRWRAGFAWRDAPQRTWSLDGSMLAWSLGSSELYASFERRHWGPGWMGSLILDGAAPALPALGWRRTRTAPNASTLRWLGPWTADVFVARLQGHSEPERPLLIGSRLQFEPLPGLEIGLARTLQWGGAGRNETLRSLLRALLGRDNLGSDGVVRGNEPGNQLAGFDWHWSPDPQRLPSFYGQAVGEDEAGLLPSRKMVLLGADMPLAMQGSTLRVFAEAADTIAGDTGRNKTLGVSYRHHAYAQGYSHAGALLGHPAGGDVRLVSLGALVQRGATGAMAAVSVGRAESTAQRFAVGSIGGLNFAAHVDVTSSQRVGTGLWWWRDAAGSRGEAQLWWQHRY